jgi:energy-converting hydrogenase Eha subunit A
MVMSLIIVTMLTAEFLIAVMVIIIAVMALVAIVMREKFRRSRWPCSGMLRRVDW